MKFERKNFSPRVRTVLAAVGLVAIGGVAGGAVGTWSSARFSDITAHSLTIMDPDGTRRLVIHNGAKAPPARMRGKDYPRSVSGLAGITVFDARGEETGGFASSTQPNGARQFAMIYDYNHQFTDGVSIGKQESADGRRYVGGIFINDRNPYADGPIVGGTDGVQRVALTNDTGVASLVLSGTDGKPRIRIGVDAHNQAEIAILDSAGKVVRSLTDSAD